jgi:hypothetical protein
VYRVEVQGVHKSGGNEIRGDEPDGPVSTPIKQVDRSLTVAHVNEVAHMVNAFQPTQHTAKSRHLGDDTERLVAQSPAGHKKLISSAMVPPLWNEEHEEREEALSSTDPTNHVILHGSNLSYDKRNN